MNAKRRGGQQDVKIAGLYDLEETIGRGHFAVVKLAKHVYTGEKVAVKVIDKNKLDDISKSHLFQEVRCMKLVQHPNVVRLYQVIDTPSKLYLILELGDGGDMYDYIMKHKNGLDENSARRYFKQIVQAIHYCHKLHVVHRDLKPENVVFFEKLGIVKLTDFGFSNKFVPGSKLETSCGSLAYSAPEILLGDSYDAPAVDVWSLGVILYMLVCGEAPFQEANDSETLTMIMDCKYRIPVHISDVCKELISLMLVREPVNRARLEEILSHQWLTQGDVQPVPLLPLISREHISDEDHTSIIQKMVDLGIGTKEDIVQSLENNEYNHISATYYLWAERLLRKQREQQAMMLVNKVRPPVTSAPTNGGGKPNLAPLALSPRGKQKLVNGTVVESLPQVLPSCGRPNLVGTMSVVSYSNMAAPSFGGHVVMSSVQSADITTVRKKSVGSLISPQASPAPQQSSSSSLSAGGPTTSDRGHISRRISLIKEESITEDDEEYDPSDSPTKLQRRDTEGYTSDDSDSRSTGESPVRLAPPASRRTVVRPLHTVRSSPQLLNQIFEEGESDPEDILMEGRNSQRSLTRANVASPDLLRKLDAARTRRITSGSRGTSCSSSDASDTDEKDSHKRKEKLKQRFSRRDSSDHSSDTDAGPGPGGGGSGSSQPFSEGPDQNDNNRDHRDRDGKGKDNQDNNRKGHKGGKERRHGGSSGKQNGMQHKRDSINSETSNQSDLSRKVSNLTLSSASNISLGSLSSRSSKYVVGDSSTAANTSPNTSKYSAKDIERMNEENKQRTRIHVRSNEFTNLVERFSAAKHDERAMASLKEPGTKFRRRPKEKMKTDINRNGLIAHADNEMTDLPGQQQSSPQQPQQVVVKTKCCSLF